MKKFAGSVIALLITILVSIYIPQIRNILGMPDIYILIKDKEKIIMERNELENKLHNAKRIHKKEIENKDAQYNNLRTEFYELKIKYNELENDILNIDAKFFRLKDLFNCSEDQFLHNLDSIINVREKKLKDISNCTRISLKNNSDTKICVAVHYRNPFGLWVTEGWWSVEPSKTVDTNIYSTGDRIHYYAHGGGHKWGGNKKMHVSSDRFFFLENLKLFSGEVSIKGFSETSLDKGCGKFTLEFVNGDG